MKIARFNLHLLHPFQLIIYEMTNSLDALAQGNEEFDDEDDDDEDEDTTDTEDLEDGEGAGQSHMTFALKFSSGGTLKVGGFGA